MTVQEMATEIIKVWIAQRGQLASGQFAREIKEAYLAAVKAIEESYDQKEG